MNSNSNNRVRLRRHERVRMRLGPSGIHLFDRASGLNILIDEVVPPETVWAAAPRQVSIAITNTCDLACSYCFAPKTRAILASDRILSWLNELDANGTIGIGFGGGEPTLYPQFADLCAHAARNTGLAVTFTTHGHHLDNSLLAMLKGNVHFIRVSMDGIDATYERLRARSFNVLRERLIAIKKVVPFGINYVVNSDTIQDIDAAADFAEKSGASEFLLLPERPLNKESGFTGETAEELRTWIGRYSGRMRLSISERGVEGIPICNLFVNESGLRAYAHIDAHGVLKCTSFDNEGVTIGSNSIMSALIQLHQQTGATL